MSYNGSGTFNRSYNWTNDATNGILVRSDRMDGQDNEFATGLSTVICKDGQTTTTAAIPFAVGLTVADGSVSTPAMAFTSESSTGVYLVSSSNLGIAVSGIKTAQFSSSNFTAGTHYTVSSATPLYHAGTSTGYFQHSLQNTSNGTGASTDLVCTADTGTDTTNYINMGINSSAFSGSAPFNLALDGYLYTQSTNLNIGTNAAKALNFATNGAVVGSFSSAGDFSINTNKFTVANSTGNTTVAGTLAVTGHPTLEGVTATGATGTGNLVFSASPTLTGSPIAPTQTAGDNSTKLATTAYVDRGSSGAAMVLLGTATASSSATINFTSIPATYDHYILKLTGVLPATNAQPLLMQFSTNNGSTYISTASYFWTNNILQNSGSQALNHAAADTSIQISGSVSNAAFGVYGDIILMLNQSSAGAVLNLAFSNSADLGRPATCNGGAEASSITTVNAFQVYFTSGNIASGKFALYGVRNS